MELDYDQIREKVRGLLAERRVTKTNLGKILKMTEGEEHHRVSYIRGKRFLDGPGKISTGMLQRVADFFDKPLSYFLEEPDVPSVLRMVSELKNGPEGDLEVVSGILRRRGLKESKIDAIIEMVREW